MNCNSRARSLSMWSSIEWLAARTGTINPKEKCQLSFKCKALKIVIFTMFQGRYHLYITHKKNKKNTLHVSSFNKIDVFGGLIFFLQRMQTIPLQLRQQDCTCDKVCNRWLTCRGLEVSTVISPLLQPLHYFIVFICWSKSHSITHNK